MDISRTNADHISNYIPHILVGATASAAIATFGPDLIDSTLKFLINACVPHLNKVFPNSLYEDVSALIKEKEKCNHVSITSPACLALANILVDICTSKFDSTCEKANKQFNNFLAEAKSFEDLPIYPCNTKIRYFDDACHDKWVGLENYDHWKTHLQMIKEFKEFMIKELPHYERLENTCSKLPSPSQRLECNRQGDIQIKACAGAPTSQTCVQEKLIFERFLDERGIKRQA